MSTDVSTATNTTHHSEHLADRAAMLAMRTVIALQPKADLGPAGRTAFDELMEKTPSADGVTYEAASVGGVPGWWCRPAEADVGPAILYLHGGVYVVGSARAYRHFAGQIASRARSLPSTRPIASLGPVGGALPPEVALLYKAKDFGQELDWDAVLPRLGKPARAWLADAVATAHPESPYLERL